MAEKQNPVTEPLKKSAQAANLVRGAVKTGKAIAGAAKGAAAGGPAGAAVGFLWANRKLLAKILVAVIAVLMIPIVILCMLPSAIFGGLGSAHTPADPDNPILNSSIAITESAGAICQCVDDILSEALAAVTANIRMDFENSAAAQMDIINPYAGRISYDAVKLVSLYCAYKALDYASISIDDMAQLLRRNMDALFSYTWTAETRPVMTTDPETGEPIPLRQIDPETNEITIVTEVWRIYTVAYHADALFAQQIFSLTEAQKELAENYAENLNLFLQDRRFSSNLGGAFRKDTHIDISGYRDPASKNNLDLVQWAIDAEKKHWGYVMGTFGTILDEAMYTYKLEQYPEGVGIYSDFIIANWLGGRTADCVGLIKGYGWLDTQTLEVRYGTNGMPDIGCDAMYYNAVEKGAIDSIPEIPGLGVWLAGHIGIYIGNGEVIEAMGTRYGVIRTQLSEGRWTHWLKIPYITYF